MTGVTANATDDIGCEIAGLRAVVFTMSDLAAVLAGLVLVIAECSVESGELAELIALEFVLTFRDGGGLSRISSYS